uniref:Adenylate cyclase activating polypeptide 1b n=1 Tax=Xiphophorus maculatus TaxID=8083 RepID=A0A3B5Q9M6_XIPMA
MCLKSALKSSAVASWNIKQIFYQKEKGLIEMFVILSNYFKKSNILILLLLHQKHIWRACWFEARILVLFCFIFLLHRISDDCLAHYRLENDAFDEDGNSLSDMGFDSDQLAIRSPPSLNDDAYSLYYPSEKSDDNSMEEESEPLSKRHSDGIFTDSYSRYRKQMAVQKYLAAVLGRRYRQRVRNKGRRLAYL